MELYELRQLVAFAECGTLSNAAESLHLSQPALSRNMKKLEEEFGIPLFLRGKNHLALNENGTYVVELAKELLADADALQAKARAYDRKSRTISMGVCAPAPVWLLSPLLSSQYPDKMIQTEIAEEAALIDGIENGSYQLIVLTTPPDSEAYFVKECGRENLMFSLPKEHRYAGRKSLTFAEMNGENMLLMNDIGFWKFVHSSKMPDSRFLTQSDRFSFNELVRSSSLPSFSTDLANRYINTGADRVDIPISDPDASVTYYLAVKKEQRKMFRGLFASL